MIETTLKEAKRVMTSKGTLFIIEVLPSTIRDALWYGQLNKELSDRYCKHFPTAEKYLNMLETIQYKCVSKFNILGRDNYSDYVDPTGPLRKDWRRGVSLFAAATEEEIKDIEQKVRDMNKNGTVAEYIKERERVFEIGLLTVLACILV